MTYQRIYIDPVTGYMTPDPKPPFLWAVEEESDNSQQGGHMASCLGVCGRHRRCPFGGCKTDSSGFNPGCPSPTLH